MMIDLLPIGETEADNPLFRNHPDCQESLAQSLAFFKQVGYVVPWIGYYARQNDVLVGMGAFVGPPREGRVEVAYGTFPAHQHRGIGAAICQQLVQIALRTDPSLTIIAHTLPAENFSTKILAGNGFVRTGLAHDDEEGEVWEWTYLPSHNPFAGTT